jgi:AcrR family transcriptional regulator
MAAALRRVEVHGVDSITVRDLARDTGVNHRAIYRHFPNKDALMASVAEGCWKDFVRSLRKSIANTPPGEPLLVASGMATYLYGRDHPNLFQFVNTGRYPFEGRFPDYEAAVMEVLQIHAVGFAGAGVAPDAVVWRAALYMSALQGIVTQILHRRLRLAPELAIAKMTEACSMLVKGLTSAASVPSLNE